MKCIILCCLILCTAWGSTIMAQADSLYKTMDTATVKVTRRALKQSARGAVLDVSRLPDAKTMTLADALLLLPGVDVDENGITYMGKKIAIQRDGVKVAGFDKVITGTLNMPDISQYKNIEINLYDLKTEQPTISFVAHKYPQGISGSVNANTGLNSHSLNGSVSVSRNAHLINVFTQNNLLITPPNKNYREIQYLATAITEKWYTETNPIPGASNTVGISDGVIINDRHIINASVSYRTSISNYKYVNVRETQKAADPAFISKNTVKGNSPAGANGNIEAVVTYTYKPRPTKNTTQRFDLSFEYENNNSGSIINGHADEFVLYGTYNSRSDKNNQSFFGLAGYEYRHKQWGNFEAVIKYFTRNNNQSYYYRYQKDISGNDSTIIQQNDIEYNYAALLASWDKTFKPFAVRFILKQDYSYDLLKNETVNNNTRRFFTLSPYVSLLKQLKQTSLRFESQFSQSRPALEQMANIRQLGGQYQLSGVDRRGNPNLVPSKILANSFLLNTSVKHVNISMNGNYTYTSNIIVPYKFAIDTLLIETYRNLAASNSFSFSSSAGFYVFPRFNTSLGVVLGWGNFKQDENNVQNSYRWGGSINCSYTILPNFQVRAGANYNKIKNFQSVSFGRIITNFSTGYGWKKMSFNLSVSNWHRPYFDTETLIETENFIQYFQAKRRMMNINLSANYRFGKLRRQEQRGKAIIKDDM